MGEIEKKSLREIIGKLERLDDAATLTDGANSDFSKYLSCFFAQEFFFRQLEKVGFCVTRNLERGFDFVFSEDEGDDGFVSSVENLLASDIYPYGAFDLLYSVGDAVIPVLQELGFEVSPLCYDVPSYYSYWESEEAAGRTLFFDSEEEIGCIYDGVIVRHEELGRFIRALDSLEKLEQEVALDTIVKEFRACLEYGMLKLFLSVPSYQGEIDSTGSLAYAYAFELEGWDACAGWEQFSYAFPFKIMLAQELAQELMDKYPALAPATLRRAVG